MSISEPAKITTPWANTGSKNPIPENANNTTGSAGFDKGFPDITMTPEEAGGLPPAGQDFNGIFYQITEIIRYMQAGGQPFFSSGLSTAIGGYPKGCVILGSDALTLWQNQVDGNTNDPSSLPAGWLKLDVNLRADLASDSGDSNVSGKGSITGEVKRNQAQKNADEISIYDFGGVDDCVGDTTGTNNFGAVSAYFTHLSNAGGVARFPKKATGGYYINGNQLFTDLSGIEIIADEGVYFVFDGSWSPLITKGIKCNRQIRIHIVSLDYDFYIGPYQYRKSSEIMPTLTQKGGLFEKPVAIDGNGFSGYLLDTTSGRDATSITTTSTTISIPFSATSQRKVAAISAKIGTEIGFTCTAVTTGTICAGVITAQGYALVEQRLSDLYTILNKNLSPATVRVGDYAGDRNKFNKASLSVRVISETKFSVMLNGVSVGTFDAGSPITGVAFGATGTTVTFVANDLYRLENSTTSGSRPLRVICLGDSTSDPAIPCSQFDYMRQLLASAGCQVVELRNLAVSGETSAQQLARFNLVDASSYDFCIAQLGINDIQGGVPVATFISNMNAIADRCIDNGLTLIAGVPTLWYPSSEATPFGQTGQNTANSDAGAPYRNQLISAMAAKGQLVTTAPLRNEGVIAAQWLTTAGIDPVLMDNIHPTAYGRMMMGLGSAMAILGAINPCGYRSNQLVAMPGRWKTAFTTASLTVPSLLIQNGELTLIGAISVPSVPANGTALITIDKELANGTFSYFTVPAQSAGGPVGVCNVVIDPSGSLTVYAVPAGTTNIVIDSITVKKLS